MFWIDGGCEVMDMYGIIFLISFVVIVFICQFFDTIQVGIKSKDKIDRDKIKKILWNQKYSDEECLQEIEKLVGVYREHGEK